MMNGDVPAKLWNVLKSIVSFLPADQEQDRLKAVLKCGQCCADMMQEKHKFTAALDHGGDVLEAVLGLLRTYNLYALACAAVDGESNLTRVTFRVLRETQDPEVRGGVRTACEVLVEKTTTFAGSLQTLLGPAEKWKDSLAENCSIQDVVKAAEQSVMRVKAKRLQSALHTLEEAWRCWDVVVERHMFCCCCYLGSIDSRLKCSEPRTYYKMMFFSKKCTPNAKGPNIQLVSS